MFYFVKTPAWLKKIYRHRIWDINSHEKTIYLSFDDGPHPTITSFVLDELKKYNAKASFFCIGNNVMKYPEVYRRILDEGHAVGNHSFNHVNGWKTNNELYLKDIDRARLIIDSNLFRPPYGKMTSFQRKLLAGKGYHMHTIMWTVLSGDFDKSISPQQCASNVIRNSKQGSIIVFHDSEKAEEKMHFALPLVLKHFSDLGFRFDKIRVPYTA
ncbi:MAG: polysaccharide deacetylase family protein [Chitinophagaceae bacterium]